MQYALRRSYWRCLPVILLVAVGTLAGADDVRRRSSAAEAAGERVNESRALAFRVSGTPVRIDADIRLKGEVMMSERRFPSADVQIVHLFTRGSGHLGALKEQDARTPGRVQVRIWRDGTLVVDASLTDFFAKYAADSRNRTIPGRISTNGQCEENCEFLYNDCLQSCDPQGQGCENCWTYFNDCMASCPTCDDWEEVSRTLIGRRYSGSSNILGARYCHFEEYYLVEETNPAGCYPNRTVCDYDDDVMFHSCCGAGYPDEQSCCQENDPEFYCGGTTC